MINTPATRQILNPVTISSAHLITGQDDEKMRTMELSEIKKAIAKLSPDDRRALTESLTRTHLELTQEERSRIQEQVDATPEDQWVDWEVLKKEFS